jgi:hypothetical protein
MSERMVPIGAACANCRHHSSKQRAKVVGVADGEMEIVEVDDTDIETVYFCQHPQGAKGNEVGIGPEAGAGCSLYELGTKRGLDPELERRLAARIWRKDDEG